MGGGIGGGRVGFGGGVSDDGFGDPGLDLGVVWFGGVFGFVLLGNREGGLGPSVAATLHH